MLQLLDPYAEHLVRKYLTDQRPVPPPSCFRVRIYKGSTANAFAQDIRIDGKKLLVGTGYYTSPVNILAIHYNTEVLRVLCEDGCERLLTLFTHGTTAYWTRHPVNYDPYLIKGVMPPHAVRMIHV